MLVVLLSPILVHANETEDRINANYKKLQETGRVQNYDKKNEFGEVIREYYRIAGKGEKNSPFLYVVNTETKGFNFGIDLSRGSNKLATVYIGDSINIKFDEQPVMKFKTLPCDDATLCILKMEEFKQALMKADKMQIGIPYDSGTQIVEYNISQIKKIL